MSDYRYTKVDDGQKKLLDRLSTEFEYLDEVITRFVPVGRRRALALTNLEQAAMWASKAVSKDWPETYEVTDINGVQTITTNPCKSLSEIGQITEPID